MFNYDALQLFKNAIVGNPTMTALKQIQEEGRGVLIYHREEGRGIGLINNQLIHKDKGWIPLKLDLALGSVKKSG